MPIVQKIKEAFEFEYTCAGCGKRLREGDRFAVIGTMNGEILRGCVTNTMQQIAVLGHLLCDACALNNVARRASNPPRT